MEKMSPQQALANLAGIAQRFVGYGWNEQAIVLESLRTLDEIVNREPTPPAAEVPKAKP